MDKAQIGAIFARSEAIVDIEHVRQRGLTIRTIEAVVGCGKKLITTNTAIAGYDFYSPDRILIIDRERPVVPEDFFGTPTGPLNENVRERYSLAGWLDELIASLAAA